MRAGSMAILLPLALFWSGPCREGKPLEAAGPDLYATHCAACHGVNATGDGPRASGLPEAPADLTRLGEKYGMPLPVDTLSELIDGRDDTHAGREMPAFGEVFFADEPAEPQHEPARRIAIALILGYLETLQQPRARL